MEEVAINSEFIKLDQFLKWAGVIESGSFAKMVIQNGDVKVNGEVVIQRGKKIRKGDCIDVQDLGSFKVI